MPTLSKTESILIVGGGIVGLATAYRLQETFADVQVTILEKENRLGRHQSTHNSGVLHAGLYYKPGSAKARLAVRGIRQMTAFCKAHDIAHEICGKLVVATNDAEAGRLTDLFERGSKNGLQNLRMLSRSEIREIEPHAAGLAAIHVPEEGIVDYAAVVDALAKSVQSRGGIIVAGAEVKSLRRDNGQWHAVTPRGEFKADFLLNTAGLYCDRVCKMAGEDPKSRIVPFRGEYYKLRPASEHLVRNLIYPVPNPQFPFLGVHFTRLIHGGIEAGPNAVLALAREGYRKTDINLKDTLDAVTYRGFVKFVQRHFRMCVSETIRSYNKTVFCQSLQALVPDVMSADLETGGAGVRAQALDRAGSLVEDFQLIPGLQSLHVVNAPSPAATASLAIGEEITSAIARIGGRLPDAKAAVFA
jgi:(S)-2-hydroxyglutarate dehydrogenase